MRAKEREKSLLGSLKTQFIPDQYCRLKLHLPHYAKGAVNAFAITRERLPAATQRAESLATRFSARTDPEPFTAIAGLVQLLTTLGG